MYRFVLEVGRVLISDPIRLGKFLSKVRGEVLNFYSVLARGYLTLAFPCDHIARQNRAVTLEQVGYADIKSEGAFMNKSERQVDFARLVVFILSDGDFRLFRHLLHGKVADVTHFVNSLRHLIKLTCCSCSVH